MKLINIEYNNYNGFLFELFSLGHKALFCLYCCSDFCYMSLLFVNFKIFDRNGKV